MGEIADSMINGEFCALCGVYLEPNEKVYSQANNEPLRMPSDGESMGFPVVCTNCNDD